MDLEVVDSEKAGVVQERVMNKLRSFNGFFYIFSFIIKQFVTYLVSLTLKQASMGWQERHRRPGVTRVRHPKKKSKRKSRNKKSKRVKKTKKMF